jgi:hypothetical protein
VAAGNQQAEQRGRAMMPTNNIPKPASPRFSASKKHTQTNTQSETSPNMLSIYVFLEGVRQNSHTPVGTPPLRRPKMHHSGDFIPQTTTTEVFRMQTKTPRHPHHSYTHPTTTPQTIKHARFLALLCVGSNRFGSLHLAPASFLISRTHTPPRTTTNRQQARDHGSISRPANHHGCGRQPRRRAPGTCPSGTHVYFHSGVGGCKACVARRR